MSKRRIFYSFHYQADHWRVNQVRNIGVFEGNSVCTPNEWETILRQGNTSIENWINQSLEGTSCTVVLIGNKTSERKWVRYEIKKSWNRGNGVVGINIHGLLNSNNRQAFLGVNPFESFSLKKCGTPLSEIVKCYNPIGQTSQVRHKYIANNLRSWIEEAILIREAYRG